MNWLLRWAIALYPAAWRARYGAELAGLVEDAGSRPGDVVDLVWGAITMQVSRREVWGWVGGLGLLGLAVGAGFGLSEKGMYIASADSLKDSRSALSRTSLARIINDFELYPAERTREPIDDIIEKMRADIRISNDRVIFRYADAGLAVSALERLGTTPRPGTEYDPRVWLRLRMAGLGLAFGLVGGIMALWIRRFWFRRAFLVFCSALTGGLLLFGLGTRLPARYTSISKLRAESPERCVGKAMDEIGLAMELGNSLGYAPSGEELALVRRNVKLQIEFGNVVAIQSTFDGPWRARRMNQMMVTRLHQLAGGRVEMLDPPSYPERPDFDWPGALGIIGVLAGVSTGLRVRWPALHEASPTPA